MYRLAPNYSAFFNSQADASRVPCTIAWLATARDVLKVLVRIFQGDVLLISILHLADRPRSDSESALYTKAGSQ